MADQCNAVTCAYSQNEANAATVTRRASWNIGRMAIAAIGSLALASCSGGVDQDSDSAEVIYATDIVTLAEEPTEREKFVSQYKMENPDHRPVELTQALSKFDTDAQARTESIERVQLAGRASVKIIIENMSNPDSFELVQFIGNEKSEYCARFKATTGSGISGIARIIVYQEAVYYDAEAEAIWDRTCGADGFFDVTDVLR